MEKKPFLTLQQVQEITKTYPTPFHIYDEKAIRENARKVKEAFAWKALAVTAPACPSCSSAMFAA